MPFSQTFHGYIENTQDILLLIEGCRAGKLPMVNRRLVEKERHAIKSGTVIVFDETETGIKRWTDGFLWSPSRILGNFLVYRELESREARKINDDYQYNNTMNKLTRTEDCNNNKNIASPLKSPRTDAAATDTVSMEQKEKELVGSLTTANTSYNFKRNGLIKKTIRLTVNGNQLHVVSYYTLQDVMHHQLPMPSTDPKLSHISLPSDLLAYLNQDFNVYHQRDKAPHHEPAASVIRSSRKRASVANTEESSRSRIRVSYDGIIPTASGSTTIDTKESQINQGNTRNIYNNPIATATPYTYQFHYAQHATTATTADEFQQATLYPHPYQTDTLTFNMHATTPQGLLNHYKTPFTELPPLCDMEPPNTTRSNVQNTTGTEEVDSRMLLDNTNGNTSTITTTTTPLLEFWKNNNATINMNKLNTMNNPLSPSPSPLSSPSTVLPPPPPPPPTDVSGKSSSSSSSTTSSSNHSSSHDRTTSINSMEQPPPQGYYGYYPANPSHHVIDPRRTRNYL